MVLNIDEGNVKEGVLALVIALVEIIRDTLKIQACNRMENGNLNDAECERLGKSLMQLDKAIDQIKQEQNIAESVKKVRDALDDIVSNMIDSVFDPAHLIEEGNTQGGLNKDEHRELVRS